MTKSDDDLPQISGDTMKKRSREEREEAESDITMKMQRSETMDSVNDRMSKAAIARELSESSMEKRKKHPEDKTNDNSPLHHNMGRIKKLKLEAIFYPKFDNEVRDSDNQLVMREDMLTKVEGGLGYLETTLKHSGSLILWSGYDRYYSKNSMDNVFTTVGEILLRQHFSRSWGSCHQNEQKEESTQQSKAVHSEENEAKYFECSDYVARNELTLSFEVVTSCLGHHGAIPERDYLILTAVANRKNATFMSTSDLINFAHKFRLPHNDIWIYSSIKSARALFQLYDSLRENGVAQTVIPALTKSADGGHVQSIYPHLAFQGNILEGFVIRYVPYTTFSKIDSNHELPQMKHLASTSSQLLKLIPAEKETFVSDSSPNKSTVLNTKLRNLRHMFPTNEEETFQKEIQNILINTDGLKRRRVISKTKTIAIKAHKPSATNDKINSQFSSFIRDRMDESNSQLDEHTQQILTIIHDLDNLGDAIDYKIFHEKTGSIENTGSTERWLCIIHIHRDETFGKYFKTKSASKLPLFRGFCIELICDNCNSGNTNEVFTNENVPQSMLQAQSKVTCSNLALDRSVDENETGSLLLKMKFLPYMVRTFIIRNGLNILAQAVVPGTFERWAQQKLKKWNISTDTSLKMMQLIESWVIYAKPLLNSTRNQTKHMQDSSMTLHTDIQQIPLEAKNYLLHFEHFQMLYNQGKFSQTESNGPDKNHFRGCLFIIGICDDVDKQNSLMDILANRLGINRKISDIFSIDDMDIMRSLSLERNDSFICYMSITKKIFNIRGLIKKCGHAMFLVFHGLSKEEVISTVQCENARKKIIGVSSKLAKLECASIQSLQIVNTPPFNDSSVPDTIKKDKFQTFLDSIMEASHSLPRPDNRRGIIFFFPSIPGSGKSTLCSGIDSGVIKNNIETELMKRTHCPDSSKGNDHSQILHRDRKVFTMVGDEVREKYWPLVESKKLQDPSSILIADKNVPPVSWHSVAKACCNTNGICIPVIPSFPALSTATVTLPNVEGDYNVQPTHTYPFSLFFLATCMERVLSRPQSSHVGKLDSGCENACLVVVKFYSFYRHITADNFKAKLYEQIEQAGVICLTRKETIDVPFFRNNVDISKLPEELETALNDAINYRYSVDKKMIKATKERESLIEGQLRSLILKHRQFLIAATDDVEVSRKAFISRICNEVMFLDENDTSSNDKAESESAIICTGNFIKIVSVDVSFLHLQELIMELTSEHECIKKFIQEIKAKLGRDDSGKNRENVLDDSVSHDRFIQNTHVTLVHHSQMSQSDMRNLYGDVDGKTVQVLLDAFLFNSDIAAFSVSLKVTNGNPIQSQNSFPHITIFCGKGVSAKDANELPNKVQSNTAQKVTFPKPISISGKVAFWKQ